MISWNLMWTYDEHGYIISENKLCENHNVDDRKTRKTDHILR